MESQVRPCNCALGHIARKTQASTPTDAKQPLPLQSHCIQTRISIRCPHGHRRIWKRLEHACHCRMSQKGLPLSLGDFRAASAKLLDKTAKPRGVRLDKLKRANSRMDGLENMRVCVVKLIKRPADCRDLLVDCRLGHFPSNRPTHPDANTISCTGRPCQSNSLNTMPASVSMISAGTRLGLGIGSRASGSPGCKTLFLSELSCSVLCID